MEGETKKSATASQADEERKGAETSEVERGPSPAATTESRGAESDEEDITLGPGWMRSGSRTLTLSGTRDFAKGSSSGIVPIAGGSKHLAYCFTKEEVLALHSSVGDECPPDFLALPYILSEDPLLPVNLSQDLVKDFEELQRKYLYNICPSRASSSATRGSTRGRGRGRGRGSDRELRPRDKEGGLNGSSSGSGVYRPPRGRGRLGYSWEGEGERSERSPDARDRSERRPAWADTPVDRDAPKGRFSGGRFRGDSDSEGSELEELEDERAASDSDEGSADEAPGVGWLYKDPQNIVRGPFSNKEMHEWYLGGFFPPTLPVKKEGDENFKPLSTYEGNPFARQRKKKEKVVRREKLREMHAADLEGKSDRGGKSDWGERAERGDWRKRSDQRSSPAGEREKARETPAKKADEKPKDEGNWRMDNTKDVKVADKKPVNTASPKEAPAKKPEEKKTAVTKKAEEIIKAAKEAERARREKEEKERQENKKKEEAAAAAAAAVATSAAKSQTTAPAVGAKSKPASVPAKKDSVDMSDPESLDDILNHFPHLASDLIASSDDEGDDRSAFPAGARPVPHGGWPATAKAPWSAQELEMRQFQHFGGPGGPMPAGDRAPMHGKPPAHHMHPHPQFPGVPGGPESKAPFMHPPHHPLMGPGQPPQQFFPGLQPGFPPHAALPGMRPGVPAGPPGPHHIPSLERRQGVFDMAAIEEQLMKQSHMPPEMRMHMQQPPHAPHVPPHAAPWLMPMHGKPGHAPTLREIQEQEMRERQQRQQHPMPPQAFPHQFTPEQMLHHQMLSEQHKQMHPLMRQQLAMGVRPQVDPVFQSVWGISPDGRPLSLQEIQAHMQNEEQEERRSEGAGVNDSVEQELHDDEQNRGQQREDSGSSDESRTDNSALTQQTNDEEDIWDVPATEQEPQQRQQAAASTKADQQQPNKKQAKQQQQQKKKGNAQSQQQQQQQQQSPKSKGGAKAQQQQQTTGWSSGGAKPPSLKEIQEQEQREMLERQKQQKQAKAAAPAQGDGKNLQNLFSAWGFSSSSGEIDIDGSQQPSWGSMEETPSLREIQEQEAVQREMAQMDEQQRKRQQQQQQAQQKAASDMAWTGGRGTKKPTLAEIQAEELKQQQKRQKELQQQHKQQLKAQREQLSRFSSPWAGGAQQTTEGASPLSLREIQELEQRRAQEEANKRRKNPSAGGAEPITKLLWETRVGSSEAVPLSEIMAQEAATQPDEPKPRKEAPQPQNASDDVWSSGSGQHTVSAASPAKSSLRDIQVQEEQKSGKQAQPQQQKKGKGQQPSTHGQQAEKSKKHQNQSPQKGKKQQQQQQQQQQFKGVWGAVPSAPKTSLLDIQVNQQRAVSPPPAASAPAVPTPSAPKSAPAPAVEDDFWGETSAPKTGSGKGDNASAPAIIDESHFPALGGGKSSGANNAAKKGGQQSAKKPANWAMKTTGATPAASASSTGRRLASSGSSLPQHQQPAVAAAKAPKPTTPKPQQTKASAAANAASKKKMQKLDPSLLGFSSNLQDRIAQGQVLPIDE